MGFSGFAALTAEEWTALGTVVTAVVAVLAAGFAALQVWELRRTREDQTRPFVIVDIQPGPAWANLLVRDEDRHRLDERIEFDLTGGRPTLGRRPPSELTLALGRNVAVRSAVRRIREWREGRRSGSE